MLKENNYQQFIERRYNKVDDLRMKQIMFIE